MRFDLDVPACRVPAAIEPEMVEALAELLLGAVLGDNDDEPDDAHEDHR